METALEMYNIYRNNNIAVGSNHELTISSKISSIFTYLDKEGEKQKCI